MTVTPKTVYRTPAELVTEFHSTYGQPIRVTPQLDVPERKLRVALITEEFDEFIEAETHDDLVEIFDALGDEVYVAQGAAITHGIDLTEALDTARTSKNIPPLLQDLYGDYQKGFESYIWFFPTSTMGKNNEELDGELAVHASQRAVWRATLGMAVTRYANAEINDDIEALTIALGEIIVLCYAISAFYGVDLDVILEEIQRSNMSKLGADGKPIYYTEGPKKGKVMKGPNFSEPDIAGILSAISERGTKVAENTPITV